MYKVYIVGLVIAIALIVGIVYAEQMTFSTYYPAPYGRYRQFSTTGLTTLATDEFGNEWPTALVGIGTTDPQYKLDVKGDDANIRIWETSGAHAPDLILNTTGGTVERTWSIAADPDDGRFGITDRTAITNGQTNTNRVVINTDGEVGIGNPNPRALLELYRDSSTTFDDTATTISGVQQAGASLMIFNPNTTVDSFSQIVLVNRDSSAALTRIASISKGTNAADLAFVTEDTTEGIGERMRITSDGNVGIGTLDPEDSKGSGGYVDAQDVWLRDADGGSGAWASQVGGGAFGDLSAPITRVSTPGNGATEVDIASTQATSDGFLICNLVRTSGSNGGAWCEGKTDSTPTPTRIVSVCSAGEMNGPGKMNSFTMPVKKNHYYSVELKTGNYTGPTYTRTYYWLPLGN